MARRSLLAWSLIPIGVLVATVVAVGLLLFQPWRLFVDTTVIEASPAIASVLARGAFISHEHGTRGTVQVVQRPDGTRVLRIENLDTSNGPDLRVWLSDAPVLDGLDGWFVFDDGDYADLGPLKGNQGDQNYPIPAEVDLADLRSVSVWCARFRVSFGAAELEAVAA